MNKTSTLFVFALLAGGLLFPRQAIAQAPDKMSYQAVIRNSSGNLVTNQEVGLRVSILQNSIDGTLVYQEIYNPNPETNNNGLLTIEIGAGVPLTGTFSEIDWSDGPYFLKTETDPSGGTTYTITGISQLLSVPYALHSATAEILTGEITESQITDLQNYLTEEIDPIFSGSPASGIEVDDIDNWNEAYEWGDHAVEDYLKEESDPLFNSTFNIDIPQDGDILRYDAASQKWIEFTPNYAADDHGHPEATAEAAGFMSAADKEKLDGLGGSLSIGDTYQGGIIFWLDASGEHGLIAAPADQSEGIQWWDYEYTWTTAFASAVGAGYGNTRMIVHDQNEGNYAAQLCSDLSLDGFDDWYLPSKYELNLMYQNIGQGNLLGLENVGAFASSPYWSSTEYLDTSAWYVIFSSGYPNTNLKDRTYYVRAVRAF